MGCRVEECEKPHHANGYCSCHDSRLRRWGSTDPRPRRVLPWQERFWPKVDKSDPSGCWVWTGALMHAGYGELSMSRGQPAYAHRLSWQIAYGEIPSGMHVCHRCDNRRCVNPGHLFLGTHADNMADMAAKGRAAQPASRLTEQAVRQIRSGIRFGFDLSSLAEMYGVSRGAIYQIHHGRTWRHVV